MTVEAVQKDMLDNYFNLLKAYGYLNHRKVSQVVFAVLLLDTVSMFSEFITSDFKHDVDVIMRRIDCCSCSMSWSNANLSEPFYVMGEWNSTTIAPHTHVINDIIGLQARLDEITAKLKKVDAKANAGL